MDSINTRRVAAWAVFILGFTLMLLGLIFLLGSVAGVSRFSIFLAFILIIIGSLFAILAIKLNKQAAYLFFAAFFIMVGFFVFLSALGLIPRSIFFRAWPLISVFSGLALFPAGWRHYGAFRSIFVVPSCVFLLLGLILLIFSFRLVTFSFKQFMLDWWPLMVVLVGIILILGSFGVRDGSKEHK